MIILTHLNCSILKLVWNNHIKRNISDSYLHFIVGWLNCRKVSQDFFALPLTCIKWKPLKVTKIWGKTRKGIHRCRWKWFHSIFSRKKRDFIFFRSNVRLKPWIRGLQSLRPNHSATVDDTDGRGLIWNETRVYFLSLQTKDYQSHEFHNSRNNVRCEINKIKIKKADWLTLYNFCLILA